MKGLLIWIGVFIMIGCDNPHSANRTTTTNDIGTPTTNRLDSGAINNYQNSPDNIRVIQEELSRRGYSINIDGTMNTSTIQAIKDFQVNEGLAETGMLTSETIDALQLRGRQPASVSPSPTNRNR